jgi:enamine deaminase RidA (YjgF/YER057c/UK114 family)
LNEREQKLIDLGYPIVRTTPEGVLVDAVVVIGSLVYASGQVPFDGETLVSKGKVPGQVDVAEAGRAAAVCAANVLRAVRKHLGSLDAVERVARITGSGHSDPDFTGQHVVINGASQRVLDVFGPAGRHARTALGMAQLPLGASVEVEMIFQLKP